MSDDGESEQRHDAKGLARPRAFGVGPAAIDEETRSRREADAAEQRLGEFQV